MNLKKEILSVIHDGVVHLKNVQSRDGGFLSLSSFQPDDFSEAVSYSTTFFVSVILSCLNSLGGISGMNPEISVDLEDVRKRTAGFLINEKSSGWTWNYWTRAAKERETMPYPDDLDDTFAALAALKQYDPNLIDGKVLAFVAKMLTALEVEEGGPYRTWLAGEKGNDVDVVVNSAIAYFLSLVDVHLPHVKQFIDDAIENRHLESPYYPGICQVVYFVSRAYKGKHRSVLAEMILAYLGEHCSDATPLERAMAISSLINLGFAEKISGDEIVALLARIEKEGFQPYAFCIDPSRDGKKSYAGASVLTAAFCVEALAKYLEANRAVVLDQKESLVESKRPPFAEKIKAIARRECEATGKNLGKVALAKIDAVTDEKILLLAYDFREALGAHGRNISAEIVERLALVNLYGWLAYTIYDDFLDGAGDPLLLPAANLFSRKLAEQYAALGKEVPGAMALFQSAMNEIDEANTWEQFNCRIPRDKKGHVPENLPLFGNYENLASRSIGHALGPLTELLCLGHARESKEFLATESFFRHYLIARQLHDDAHDWAEDLACGQVNSIAALILEKYKPKSSLVSVAENLPALKHLFWTDIIDGVVELILSHITSARRAREEAKIIDPSFMENTLLSLERGAKKALEERDEALIFLEEYNNGTSLSADKK